MRWDDTETLGPAGDSGLAEGRNKVCIGLRLKEEDGGEATRLWS